MDDAAARKVIAFHRFGMGPRPGDLAAMTADPRAALKAELARPDVALIDPGMVARFKLGSTTPNIQASYAAEEQRRLQRIDLAGADAPPRASLPGVGSDGLAVTPPTDASRQAAMPRTPVPPVEQQIFRAEAQARFAKVSEAGIGFVERLVAFWSNHFCVSVRKGNLVRATAGSFEREAIRPFVLGSFLEMVLAVERHPAMLFYLDNQQSIGPDSTAGQRQKRGLNENLAREIMELHTLGVDGGYGQADVTALARALTGWTFAGREGRLGEPGAFVFNVRAHEPGDALIVGRDYPGEGEGQGERALSDLARHPATARHIATKFARHFIADDPPAACVTRLTNAFTAHDGDLRILAATLVDMPESWSAPMTKLRTPADLAMATLRLLGPVPDPGPTLAVQQTLGMPLWDPSGPNGFADTEAEWGSPEGVKLRLDLAVQAAARQRKAGGDPGDLVDAALGAAASDETRRAVGRAATREQAVALLLMAPEFQRR